MTLLITIPIAWLLIGTLIALYTVKVGDRVTSDALRTIGFYPVMGPLAIIHAFIAHSDHFMTIAMKLNPSINRD